MGLYDDEKITGGEIDDCDYYLTRWRFEMLGAALKTRQPEPKVAEHVKYLLEDVEKALEKWPDHEEVKKWKEELDKIDKKIDKSKAAESADWKEGFYSTWDNMAVHELWQTYIQARVQAKAEQWSAAYGNADGYVGYYERQSKDKSSLFNEIADYQKARFAGYLEEMKTLRAEMKKKKGH